MVSAGTPRTDFGSIAGPDDTPTGFKSRRSPLSQPVAKLAFAWLAFVALAALVSLIGGKLGFLPVPEKRYPGLARAGPSFGHPFGGDRNGKDIFWMTIYGSQVSLLVGFASVTAGMLIGGVLGVCAGYFRGKVDQVVSILIDTFLSIPAVLLAVILVVVVDPDVENPNQTRRIFALVIGIGAVAIPVLARIARAATLQVSGREFVVAARAMGARPLRVMLREVTPNVLPAMVAIGFLGVGLAIVTEGTLAVFGMSVSSPTTSWGSIIYANKDAVSSSSGQIWAVLGPSLFILLTVLALNFLGDAVRRSTESDLSNLG